MNRLKSLEFWCFVLLIINVVTVGVDFYFRRAAAALAPFPPGQTLSSTTGISAGGHPAATKASCHLVRYASVYCTFCSPKYSQAWNELEKTLTSKGCDATIVSPFSGDLPFANGQAPEYRLDGVSLQFAKSVQFTSTPITLLLDHDWKIVWSHIGILDGNDSQEALRSAGF
jgi:hypothetical protein